MTLEGLSGIEALATLGWTTEQFSNLAFVSTTFSNVVGYGVLFQTVSGVSNLISAGIRLGLDVSTVNRNRMAEQLEAIFGDIAKYLHVNLSHQFDPLDWCGSLHGNYPDELDRIDIPTRSKFGEIITKSRWVRQRTPTTDPSQESGDIIQLPQTPGGTYQPSIPDWMLPLILRLNGSKEKTPLC
ncbi:minor structural protein VP3 [Otomops polyomavirus KY156]|nr:minor structural protein VP3 [Otomops polyomavirus KY156]AGA82580.1 minor structural protein VP3 [Otomops polyomavirus KY156]